jgi:predicted dehydrogenase
MSRIVRTIHVGVGGRGKWPVEVMGAAPKFQPVAVADLNGAFLQAARESLHLPESAAFSDLHQAVNTVEADAVVICTPTRTHGPLARVAFAAGKHVLVEKGMTMDWAEAQSLVREAEAAGVRFCVAQNYRYGAAERTVTALLSDPAHPHHPGCPEIVDYIHHRYRPHPRTLDYPWAMVWDMSCHHVDSLASWLGPARRVTAHSYNTNWSKYANDADIAAFIEYESGAVCHYVLTHTATLSEWRVTLQGERGALRLYDAPGVRFLPRPTAQLGGSAPAECEVAPASRSEQGVADDFHRYIAEGVEPGISGRNNLQTLAVCEMLVRSARDRRPVERAELES